MRHQSLIILRSLIDKMLVIMTNDAYARNHKFSYKLNWIKGTGTIDDGNGNVTKNYYWLRLYMVDKTESPVGKEVSLFNNYYALTSILNVEKLEEKAYEELLLNGLRSLINITYSHYLIALEKTAVEAKDIEIDEKWDSIKESIANKPKLFTGNDFRPNTPENNRSNIIRD